MTDKASMLMNAGRKSAKMCSRPAKYVENKSKYLLTNPSISKAKICIFVIILNLRVIDKAATRQAGHPQ